MSSTSINWPHAPNHRLGERGTYFLTCGTYLKAHRFRGPERLRFLQEQLLTLARKYDWELEAWAVFSNHIHFVGKAPIDVQDATSLSTFVSELHTSTGKFVNDLDNTAGRKNWHNYRETLLTFEQSYFARLNYVHQNPVKHGLVPVANQYPWCSAAWFERNAKAAQAKTIYSFKTDRVQVFDEYEPDPAW
jgi:putative transposase